MTTQDTFNAFFSANNGKPLEVEDPTNLDQCFDLALGWCDALQIPKSSITHLNASEIWTAPTDLTVQYFDFIPNTPNGVPHVGDIVVFNGKVGHVSVATGHGDNHTFESFDQNWDTPHFHDAQGHPICRLVNHDYSNVLGWLRPKVTTIQPVPSVITDQTKIDLGSELGIMEVQAIRGTLHDNKLTIASLTANLAACEAAKPPVTPPTTIPTPVDPVPPVVVLPPASDNWLVALLKALLGQK